MQKWSLQTIHLPLKYDWAISRSKTSSKENFVVKLEDSQISAKAEVAFNRRYGESAELVATKFEDFVENCPNALQSLEDLLMLLEQTDLPFSLRAGIEMCFIHFLADLSGKKVSNLLGVEPVTSAKTFYSIPIMEPGKIQEMVETHKLKRFHALKIKVNQESAIDLVREAYRVFEGPLVIDGNECWKDPDGVLRFQEELQGIPVQFIEQPLPADYFDEYLALKKISRYPIFADESLTNHEVGPFFAERFHGVNVKLMKAGGYIRAMKQLRDARQLGLRTMVGCMVETSLGISSALNICHNVDYIDLDGFLFLKDDPFKLLFEEKGRIYLASLH